jgi:hypothetical protein
VWCLEELTSLEYKLVSKDWLGLEVRPYYPLYLLSFSLFPFSPLFLFLFNLIFPFLPHYISFFSYLPIILVVNPGPSQMIINSISLNSWDLPFSLPHLMVPSLPPFSPSLSLFINTIILNKQKIKYFPIL